MDFGNLKLYRRRFIPDELILLKDDIIYFADEKMIKTKWNVLKPRKDFAKGISWYYIKEGWKISRFMDKSDKLVYYYCDIIDVVFDEEKNSCTVNDLLADVIIYPDGRVYVVDIEEIADAFERGIINAKTVKKSLRQLDALLKIIYAGRLGEYFDMSADGENI